MTTAVTWILRGLVAALVVATLLPFVRSGAWFVRGWDFPRLQLVGIALLVLAATGLAVATQGPRPEHAILGVLLLGVVVRQLVPVLPYLPTTAPAVASSEPGDATVRLLVANLDFRNERRAEVAAMIESADADVLLLVEIDDAWAAALDEIRSAYPHRAEAVRGQGLGLTLWSRHPVPTSTVQFLVTDDRPSVHADIELPAADGTPVRLRFVGVHPTPPGLDRRVADGRHDSRLRDAELVLVARDVADRDTPVIVAGDFNDVAWSHTTRLFRRLSGLLDPRIGRGLVNTYHAEYPLLRYPLDHVFVSPGVRVGRFERRRTPGSDHFAVLAEFAVPPARASGGAPDPEPQDDDHADAATILKQGRADAAEAPPGDG